MYRIFAKNMYRRSYSSLFRTVNSKLCCTYKTNKTVNLSYFCPSRACSPLLSMRSFDVHCGSRECTKLYNIAKNKNLNKFPLIRVDEQIRRDKLCNKKKNLIIKGINGRNQSLLIIRPSFCTGGSGPSRERTPYSQSQ